MPADHETLNWLVPRSWLLLNAGTGGIHCAGSDLQLVGYAGFAAVWQASSIAKGVDCERRMVDGERTVDQGGSPNGYAYWY
ncbi:hypothetical protein [Nocardia sp. NBC_01388]|uniref:hypothetical protein n=1 Tax=Nocardia sp. NBC_01388 TaxID=2903596 RepID=UPI003245B40D